MNIRIARVLRPLHVLSIACFLIVWNARKFSTWNASRKQRQDHQTTTTTKTKSQLRPSFNKMAYPTTDFTPHVQALLETIDLNGTCGTQLNLTVTKPFSIPTVHCPDYESYDIVSDAWCKVLKRIFRQRAIPTSISLSFSRADRKKANKNKHGNRCFESSSVNGTLCMTNFLEMERMKNQIEYPIMPWENRSSIPIWRGSPWMKRRNENETVANVVDNAIARSPRLRVVAWSLNHSNLLDARIGSLDNRLLKEQEWKERLTNGMHKLYPGPSFLPPQEYYTKYQVALVLGGFGAAFRTSIHLSTETAIVLQEYLYKEWFTDMMKPYIHYIPLREDLSDLEERMLWIRDNPVRVREIARNGRKFYERYLSFEKNEEHIVELAYRMGLRILSEQ